MAGTTIREITPELLVSSTTLVKSKLEKPSAFLKRLTHLRLEGNESKKIKEFNSTLSLCKKLRVLYAYDNVISRIQHLEFATSLTHLYLQNNNITSIEGLSATHKLQKLFLQGNAIASVSGLEQCPNITELNLNNQRITSALVFDPETVRALSYSLKTLRVSNCSIESPFDSGICDIESVETLDLSKNKIAVADSIMPVVQSLLHLTNLDVKGNAVCTNVPRWREEIVVFSKRSLVLLNDKPIDSRQRMMMQSLMQHKQSSKKKARPEKSGNQERSAQEQELVSSVEAQLAFQERRKQPFSMVTTVDKKKSGLNKRVVEGLNLSGGSSKSPF